jgi:hypothetical protein
MDHTHGSKLLQVWVEGGRGVFVAVVVAIIPVFSLVLLLLLPFFLLPSLFFPNHLVNVFPFGYVSPAVCRICYAHVFNAPDAVYGLIDGF